MTLHWFWLEVRGNILAIIPSGLLLWLYLRSKHAAVMEAHETLRVLHMEQHEKLVKRLDKLDPDADDGVRAALNVIEDQLNPNSEGGIHPIIERLDKVLEK